MSLGLSGLGISEEHAELATSLRKWAVSLGGTQAARASEADHHATFDEAWSAVAEMKARGLPKAWAAYREDWPTVPEWASG